MIGILVKVIALVILFVLAALGVAAIIVVIFTIKDQLEQENRRNGNSKSE